ncbi:glycoside hydrolase [Rhodocytophaga rosea]|uniref:Glycoside hydrolase n=1 Tax=Rhodocytophaga rosea TaxID=2704465 RepID=A0A6C0GN13_9BACT|nr:glycosyl hydrolase [Rhodocytophaga rosea]QHT69234.1 glycoside hydrolase [Rhodocytophaga rosea]
MKKLIQLFLLLFLLYGTDTIVRAQVTVPVREGKPWAYWWWMGSAITREGIKQNLEAYARAGMGGLHIIPIYGVKGFESQYISYLSPQWMEMLQYTVQEAGRLNMGIDMSMGTGWPFGGKQVTREAAAKKFMVREFVIPAGKPFSYPIKTDPTHKEALLQVASLYTAQNEFIQDVTGTVDPQGNIHIKSAAQLRKLVVLYSVPTGQKVKRAAPGGEGLVLDYFSKDALQHYTTSFQEAFEQFKTDKYKVRSFYNDSYEVYGANWTDNFLQEFSKRRGYDFSRYIHLLNDTVFSEQGTRVLTDYQETISDLLLENFTQPWAVWVKERGLITRNQAHGSPGNILDYYAAVDIPETESFGSKQFDIPLYRLDKDFDEKRFGKPNRLTMKFASSAANISGKPLVSAETSTWLGDHFKVAPSQIKPLLDEQFTAGVNHIFFHGITYSPPDIPWPGWLFYASTNYAPSSHFWNYMPEITGYISRIQSVMQQTRPDNNVLLYFPIYDLWSKPKGKSMIQLLDVHYASNEWLLNASVGKTGQVLLDKGYQFDYISDRQLQALEANTRGELLTNANIPYQTLVIPACTHMPLETMKAIVRLVEKGVEVVFVENVPQRIPGFHNYASREGEMKQLQARLKASKNTIIISPLQTLTQDLMNIGVQRESLADQQLSFIRKNHAEGKVYFVTNLHNRFTADTIQLNTSAQSVELYNPLMQEKGLVPFKQAGAKSIKLYLTLAPGQSCIITTYAKKQAGNNYVYQLPDEAAPISLQGNWNLTFTTGEPAIPAAVTTSQLTSWTTLGDSLTQYFSGTGVYTLQFTLPATATLSKGFLLDLGDVREMAQVTINGQNIGKVWSLPYRLYIKPGILKKENTLQIAVTNLSANRIRYMDKQKVEWKKFHEINFVNIRYEPFDAAKWEPVVSGLLGPVQLIPLK